MAQTERPGRERDPHKAMTRRNFFGHGGDTRYVMVSTDPEYLTAEQLATILGLACGTIRDQYFTGRRGSPSYGVKIGNTWLIHVKDAHQILKERWNL